MKEKRENIADAKVVKGDFRNASGPVRIRMTNDYLFKALLQNNKKVLRGLICSMLHMEEADLYSVDIRNPIVLGESVSEKDIILDVNVVLNSMMTLDLEMQVVNEGNWTSRSLYYVCWNYTKLAVGDSYDLAQPAIHIGFLDFTLFKEHADFYSTYKLLETTHHYEYTDKLQIRVLDLTKIELATKEDRDYNIDKWARLFKAQTWEIRMLAVNDQAFTEAATTIYQLSEDERIRQQCEAREDYLRR